MCDVQRFRPIHVPVAPTALSGMQPGAVEAASAIVKPGIGMEEVIMVEFHPYEKVDFDFFDRANFRTTQSIDIHCTPPQLTDALSGDAIWVEWVAPIREVAWHAEKPFQQGVQRTVQFGGHIVREEFFKWDPEEGIAFRVLEGTQKNVTAMAEHYRFESLDGNTTRLVWSLAMDMTGFAGFIAPVTSRLAGRGMQGWLKQLKAIVEKRTNG